MRRIASRAGVWACSRTAACRWPRPALPCWPGSTARWSLTYALVVGVGVGRAFGAPAVEHDPSATAAAVGVREPERVGGLHRAVGGDHRPGRRRVHHRRHRRRCRGVCGGLDGRGHLRAAAVARAEGAGDASRPSRRRRAGRACGSSREVPCFSRPSPWTCSRSSSAARSRCCRCSRRTSCRSDRPAWAGCAPRPRPAR